MTVYENMHYTYIQLSECRIHAQNAKSVIRIPIKWSLWEIPMSLCVIWEWALRCDLLHVRQRFVSWNIPPFICSCIWSPLLLIRMHMYYHLLLFFCRRLWINLDIQTAEYMLWVLKCRVSENSFSSQLWLLSSVWEKILDWPFCVSC